MSEMTTPRRQPSALRTILCIAAVVIMCLAPFFMPGWPKADYAATVVSKKIESTTTLVPIGANGEMATVSSDTHYVTVKLNGGGTYTASVSRPTYNAVNKEDSVTVTAEMNGDKIMKIVAVRPLKTK